MRALFRCFPLPELRAFMNIVVNEELKAYIDPLTPEEYDSLERSILAEGCRDALVLWGDVLVDGHNRYGICRKHDLPFQTVQNPRFKSIEDVHLWMIDQHLGPTSSAACSRCANARSSRSGACGRPRLTRRPRRKSRPPPFPRQKAWRHARPWPRPHA
jgi:hypothetical protein